MILTHVILTTLAATGLALLLVEKHDKFPVKYLTQLGLKSMFSCYICTGFWTGILMELLHWYVHGWLLWFTPFWTVLFLWIIVEILNILEKMCQPKS